MKIDTIKRRLKKMRDEDQKARGDNDFEAIIPIDARNTQILQKIVEEHGWPTISKFGKLASERAWLIAQHADQKPELQAHWLNLMLAAKDDVNPWNIAYLTDRVMLVQQGVQRYGTQLIKSGDHYVLRSLEDKDRLDELRAEMGLNPIREYLDLDYWKAEGGAYIDEEDYQAAQSAR